MKIKGILLTIIIAILITLLTIAAFVTLPWLGIYVGTQSLDNPPSPEITYGEFPFKLVYEINGETKVIEDTLICEYDGIGMDEGQGKYRKWKERLASGNKKIHILNTDGALGIVFRKEKTLKQEIYYDPGPASYYMGDFENSNEYKHNFPDASFLEQYQDETEPYGILPADELLEKYNIKLISWDYTQPIKNNFSTTKK